MIKRIASACAALAMASSASLLAAPAAAQEEFKIGVVASLTGGFAGPAKDSMDGIQAWIKLRGLKGKKIVLETLDDETNPVSATNAFRRLASDPKVMLIYAIVPSSSVMAIKSLASEFKVPIIEVE